MQVLTLVIIAVLVNATHAWHLSSTHHLSMKKQTCTKSRYGSSYIHGSSSTALEATQSQSAGNKGMSTAKTIAASIGAVILAGCNVNAASYGGFGRGGSAVLDPATSVIDAEIAKSDTFKTGLNELYDLKGAVTDLEAALVKDPQIDVVSQGKTLFNVAKVRESLNKFNSVFGEDTQRGTDRLIRGIIQDITELERENAVKPGKQRSEVKILSVQKRLAATEAALNELSAFYK